MKRCFYFCALIFFVSAGEDESTTSLQDLALANLPPGALDKLPPGFNASNIPSIEEGEKILKEKCLKNGKNDSFEVALAAKDEVQVCLKRLVNYTEIKDEIEKAKPTGDLDAVFRKYCKKSPMLRDCVNNFTSAMEPCLDESEKISKRVINNITDALVSFICFKEGDRIALFIAEGGPECLNDKQEAIMHCLNVTLSKRLPTEVPDINALPLFKLEEAECRDINVIQRCVVTELEKCAEPTPANIIDSLFNFVRKATPCAQYKSYAEGSTGAGAAAHIPLLTLVLLAAISPVLTRSRQ